MARSRILSPALQALLGLLFLAWLPVFGDMGSESTFLLQVEETLTLSELPDGGEPDRDGGPDDFAQPGAIRLSQSAGEQGLAPAVPTTGRLAELLEARPATGPPAVRG